MNTKATPSRANSAKKISRPVNSVRFVKKPAHVKKAKANECVGIL